MAKLTARQDRALCALLKGRTLEAAARAAGVSRVTVWRWQQAPEFRRALRELRRQSIDRVMDAVRSSGDEAIRALRAVLKDQDRRSQRARVSAARAILGLFESIITRDDLQGQLEEVKELAKRQSGGANGRA